MKKPTVIVLGSASYIKPYSKYLNQEHPKALLLVVDVHEKPKFAIPKNARFLRIDAKRKNFSEVLQHCEAENLDVLAVVNRVDSLESLHGKLCDHFKVDGPSETSINKLANKANLHKLAVKSNLSFYRPVTIITPLKEAESRLDELQFPVVMKKSRDAKSRGVIILSNKTDFYFYKNLFLAEGIYKPGTTILFEQLIRGKQVTPSVYVDENGKIHIMALVDVVTAKEDGQNHMQLMYRSTPSMHPEMIRQKISYVIQKLITKAKIKSVVLHPELFVVGNNVYLIEINVRIGGFRYEMMKQAYDIDLTRISWLLAFGSSKIDDQIKSDFSCTACEVWEEKSGKIEKIKVPKSEYICLLKQKKFVGDEYKAPPEQQIPIAYFYVKDKIDSLKIAQKLRKQFVINLS